MANAIVGILPRPSSHRPSPLPACGRKQTFHTIMLDNSRAVCALSYKKDRIARHGVEEAPQIREDVEVAIRDAQRGRASGKDSVPSLHVSIPHIWPAVRLNGNAIHHSR